MDNKLQFGTSGIRGPVDTLFTHQFCFDIGRTFIEFLKRHYVLGSIAIGMDPRSSSPQIKSQVSQGLRYTKEVELFDEGATPIPSLNWLIKTTPIVAAIMVTGSHIAANLNGVKFFAHGEEISFEDQENILKIYEEIKNKVKPPSGEIEVHPDSTARDSYAEMLVNQLTDDLPKWKIALDCANGAQSFVMPQLFKRLGIETVVINDNPETDFIARDTDTDDKAGLEELKELVVREKCNFGVAFDGDGDRGVFIDENGQFVLGEYSCSVVARSLSSQTIVTTIAASQVVDHIGKRVFRTKVGSPLVIGKIKETDAGFGFEPNGGAVFPENMLTRDGGSMIINMFNVFAKHKGTFSEMIGQLPKFYMFRTKLDYPWELKDEIIKKAKENFKGIKMSEEDGLKIWFDETTWMLFRSSANAPEFRVFAESVDESKSKKLLADGLNLVQSVIDHKNG